MDKGKPIRSVMIPAEVDADIRYRIKTQRFNFSEWVTQQYISEYMDSSRIDEELAKLDRAKQELIEKREKYTKILDSMKYTLSDKQKRWLGNVPFYIKGGGTMQGCMEGYNMAHGTNFTIGEFSHLVEVCKNAIKKKN